MSSHRPRRTRIYNTNYDIGESYYKKQLQNLDSKRNPTSILTRASLPRFGTDYSSPNEDIIVPKVSFANLRKQDEDDDTYDFAKPKLLNTFKDRIHSLNFDDELDGDVSLVKPRRFASKLNSALTAYGVDNDDDATGNVANGAVSRKFVSKVRAISYDTNVDNFKRSSSVANDRFSSSLLDNFEDQLTNVSRRSKLRADNQNLLRLANESDTKFAIEATSRAKATKDRLAELESEMLSITEKQNEREKRRLDLKKLLTE